MTKRLSELADLIDGELLGPADLEISGANPPTQSQAGEITMLQDPSDADLIASSAATAVVTNQKIETLSIPQVVVESPHEAFAAIVACFRPRPEQSLPRVGVDPETQISATALIHPSATVCKGVRIGQNCMIMPGVVIMPGSSIGDDCTIHANVTLYEHTEIADRVTIHAGTVIGANGFGYRQESGRHLPTSQLGYVAIESDVEIGAAVTIDRGTYGATRIGEGTKIDNQVMIGHNCQIGRHNLLCSQVGIAGSCTTGDYVILAGQVGLKDHIKLGDKAIVGAQAGVMDDCDGDQVYLGSPATPQRDQMQIMAVQRKLPEMRREIKQLRRQLDALLAESDNHGSGKKAA